MEIITYITIFIAGVIMAALWVSAKFDVLDHEIQVQDARISSLLEQIEELEAVRYGR